jgi:site-specific DNA-methyltransferase (adenine-specific)
MKFNIVVGNPPYNNDLYIPFVENGHKISTDCSEFITPVRWQGKGGKENESFRYNIVPYMSKIVYYPESNEIFDIAVHGGISYYIIDKIKHNKKYIASSCKKKSVLSTNLKFEERESSDITKITLLNKDIQKILDKVHIDDNLFCIGGDAYKKYHVMFTALYNESKGQFLNNSGNALVLAKLYYKNNTIKDNNSTVVINSFDSEAECKSLISYLNSKFIRFLLLIGKVCMEASSKACWRFVPEPVNYDHIFTDKELYEKYGLTDYEINIIESTIKSRV